MLGGLLGGGERFGCRGRIKRPGRSVHRLLGLRHRRRRCAGRQLGGLLLDAPRFLSHLALRFTELGHLLLGGLERFDDGAFVVSDTRRRLSVGGGGGWG